MLKTVLNLQFMSKRCGMKKTMSFYLTNTLIISIILRVMGSYLASTGITEI